MIPTTAPEIKNFIAALARSTPSGGIADGEEPLFGEPLVGLASGADPLHQVIKDHIGPFYWTPAEALGLAFDGRRLDPENVTVISWVLPASESTRKKQRAATELPSRRWILTRKYGEEINVAVRRETAAWLNARGIAAAAPALLPAWGRHESPRFGFASNWSERHAAYAAGLGTFSLSDGLITARGVAVRCGSVVATRAFPPTPRPYQHHQENCLYFPDGKCGVCIRRCPAGAIGPEGHDKVKCKQYIRGTTALEAEKLIGVRVNACGLCQAGVPCEFKIPKSAPRTETDKEAAG